MNGWVVFDFQFDEIPATDEFDRVDRAGSTTRLAVRAVVFPSGEVLFNGVKRANLNTFVAVDATALDFSLADPKEIKNR